MFDALIVGAGFAGSVLAERLANETESLVLLIDRRSHIGGNAYDRFDASGEALSPYGRHVLQTDDRNVLRYLSRFAKWERCDAGRVGEAGALLDAEEGRALLTPVGGYTRMFEKMLSSPNIKIMLKADYTEVRDVVPFRRLIYTGSLDEYFDYCYGKLPYWPADKDGMAPHRAPARDVAGVDAISGHPEDQGGFPVAGEESTALFQRYQDLAEATVDAYFTGRLAAYRYCTIDEVVAQSLALFERIKGEFPGEIVSRGASSVGSERPEPRAAGTGEPSSAPSRKPSATGRADNGRVGKANGWIVHGVARLY
jgi:UDP-galactopyranose mutase